MSIVGKLVRVVRLAKSVHNINNHNSRFSLFISPDSKQITRSFSLSNKVKQSSEAESILVKNKGFNMTAPVEIITQEVENELKRYILPLNQPVVALDCEVAFNNLSVNEKLYAHYLSIASWYGGLIVPVQTSPESPVIIAILLDLFKSNNLDSLKKVATDEAGFSEDDWKALLVYTVGLFANAGNYKSFGDTKIIPGVAKEKLEVLVKLSSFSGMAKDDVLKKWLAVKDKVYSLSEREKQMGLGDKGITTYFSQNCTLKDSEKVNRYMKSKGMEAWMTRVFKTEENGVTQYEIRNPSVKPNEVTAVEKFEDSNFIVTRGDYSIFLSEVCANLEKAKKYAANETEVLMLESYIKCFTEGSLDAHKQGSRYWIKDKGPTIETYIGFIENYRDPTGVRSEFESFVSVVNKPMSEKFQALVDNATEYLKYLPWPKEFEKDVFLRPDFTSLDVLTFSGSGIPAGINIPNYDEIRQDEGFKNVSLGNVIPASYKDSVIPFLSENDKSLLNKYRIPAFEIQVGLHELLGHGSGKLFQKDATGAFNYPSDLKDPLTKQIIESYYDVGETYSSVFTSLGSSYEECRAECVGLYLSLFKDIVKVFEIDDKEADDVIYTNWLSMVFAGAAKALEMYQPETKTWMQAHSKARFVILQVLIEAGDGLLTVNETVGEDGKPDLSIMLDRSKINTVGREAIKNFLLKLQVYKSTANFKAASAMFEGYAQVSDDGKHPWARWRNIVLDKKQPRKAFVQHNTVLEGDSKVVLKSYDSSPEGLIQSWTERFSGNTVYEGLISCWNKDKPFF